MKMTTMRVEISQNSMLTLCGLHGPQKHVFVMWKAKNGFLFFGGKNVFPPIPANKWGQELGVIYGGGSARQLDSQTARQLARGKLSSN